MKEKSKDSQTGKVDRRTFLKTAGMAGVAVSTMGFPAVLRGAAPKEILIGSIHPTTGWCAYDGTCAAQGVQLAIDLKNAAGGIKSMGGAKLKVLLKDSQSKPKVGEAAAQKLIRDGCVALMGCFNSPVTLVTTKVAERKGIPHLITIAVADEILQRGFKYTFRSQPDTQDMSEGTCKYVRHLSDRFKKDIKTASIMHINGFGAVIANKVEKLAPQYGLEIIGKVSYNFGVSDLTTEISKLKGMNADVILDCGYLADGILKIKTYNDMKVEPKGGIIGAANGAFSNKAMVKELGRLSEFLMDTNYFYNPKSPLAEKVIKEYNKRFTKVIFQSHVAPTFDATLVLIDALERSGTTDPKKLRDAIAKTSLKDHVMTGGPIEFDSTGQNKNAIANLLQVQKRTVKLVMPKEYAVTDPVYPIPSWSSKT